MLARAAIVVVLLLLPLAGQAAAETRVALVMGNGSYRVGPLANPVNDARLMSATLRDLGFEVVEVVDADQRGMKRAIVDFGDRLERAGEDAVGLFFFAGHGIQVGGVNYLVPLEAAIRREKDLEVEAVSANWVLGQMEFAGNRMNLVILDACRNNPYARGFRSATRGLARMDAPRGSLVAYSTAPGDVAADGEGANSPYVTALARAMQTPGTAVEHVFKNVRRQVMATTSELQVPWEASSLTGEFFFMPGGAPAPSAATAPPPAPPAATADSSAEIVFWRSIENSKDPGDFRAYIERYGVSGAFTPLARNRIRALENEQAALTSPAESGKKESSREFLLRFAKRALEEFAGDAGAIATDAELTLAQRLDKFRGLLVYVIDFDAMGRFVLGRHRNNATLGQWDEFLGLYKEYLLTSYSFSSVESWSGDIDLKGVIPYGDDTLVKFVLKSSQTKILRVDFRVRKSDLGLGYKIVDVVLEGVSFLQTQRADFAAVLKRDGIDGLNGILAGRIGKDGQANRSR
jgi:carboxyl-terminal processing protease